MTMESRARARNRHKEKRQRRRRRGRPRWRRRRRRGAEEQKERVAREVAAFDRVLCKRCLCLRQTRHNNRRLQYLPGAAQIRGRTCFVGTQISTCTVGSCTISFTPNRWQIFMLDVGYRTTWQIHRSCLTAKFPRMVVLIRSANLRHSQKWIHTHLTKLRKRKNERALWSG